MIDRRKSDYKEYDWKLMRIDENHNGFQYTDGLNVNIDDTIGDNMVFSNGNYIFNNFDESHVFIRRVTIPIGAHITQSVSYDHAYETDKLVLEKRMDLRDPDTWDILWDNCVDIMSYKEKILYIVSKNGWLKTLMWIIDKISYVNSTDSSTVAENVLRGAISNNNVDIIEYITREYPDNLSSLGAKPTIMSSIAELAIAPNKPSDYCYPTVKSLIDNGIFNDVDPSIVLASCAVMFKSMKHEDTYRLLQSQLTKLKEDK